MKEESLLLLSDLQKLINQVVLIDYTIIILGCDFMISYNASGNSRVILKENEEIIEFLAYDRLSENEKCELYVWYRSKKNADGSWHISEAEILDIFAYNVSTKDVVSSGKTSWSATGNEKYYEITGEK